MMDGAPRLVPPSIVFPFVALTSIQHTEWTEWTKRMSEATVCMKVHHKIDSYSMKIILF